MIYQKRTLPNGLWVLAMPMTGTLVLEKDNPSGDPDLSDELGIPVRFK